MNVTPDTQNAGEPWRWPQRPLRLAFFSPLPPARSGIADYSAELLPHLAQMADLTLFCVDPENVTASLREQFEVRSIVDYAKMRWAFDLPLYQMGTNTTHHEAIFHVLRRFPGVTTLHDVILHPFIADTTAGRGHFAGYTREMGYVLGAKGIHLAWAINQGERAHPLTEFTLNQRVVDLSLGVLVHSNYGRHLIHATRPAAEVRVVPQHIIPYDPQESSRGTGGDDTTLPWREDAIVFASAGQIRPAKGIDRVLAAFAKLRHEMPRARYLLVGELFEDEVDLTSLLAQYDLEDDVYMTGYVPDIESFMAWLTKADVVISARYPTMGETSAAVLRSLAAGRPLIVYDHGWYAELPDEVALKTPVLDEGALAAAMRRLGDDADLRQQMGRQARAFAGSQRHPAQIARRYMQAVEDILARYA